MTFILGLLTGLAIGIAFILFCLWHVKRYPITKHVECPDCGVLAAETTIYAPSYLRVVK